MKLTIIGSNSEGNGYLLSSGTQTLLIECGVHIDKIKHALKFNLQNLSAIVSHAHGDHSKSISQVMKCGIDVYASKHTLESKQVLNNHRAKVIEAGKKYTIGEFQIVPFPVVHDVPCFGFLIHHMDMGLCVFLTDTCFSEYVFEGVNQFIIECNHAEDILETRSQMFLKNRIRQSHMNIDTCKGILHANNLSNVNHIVLIHLSNTNSHEVRFQKEIQLSTGKTVTVAVPGLEITNFNKNPF